MEVVPGSWRETRTGIGRVGPSTLKNDACEPEGSDHGCGSASDPSSLVSMDWDVRLVHDIVRGALGLMPGGLHGRLPGRRSRSKTSSALCDAHSIARCRICSGRRFGIGRVDSDASVDITGCTWNRGSEWNGEFMHHHSAGHIYTGFGGRRSCQKKVCGSYSAYCGIDFCFRSI